MGVHAEERWPVCICGHDSKEELDERRLKADHAATRQPVSCNRVVNALLPAHQRHRLQTGRHSGNTNRRADRHSVVVVEDLPAPSASVHVGLPAVASVERKRAAAKHAAAPGSSAGNVLPGPKTDKLLSPPPAHRPIPAAPEPVLAPPSQPVVVNLAPDPAPKVAAEDDRFASLKRSYSDRLVSMAAVFRDLPRRLSDDGPLTGLKLCEAGDDELRERTFQIFAEALGASQEQQINELQTKLAAKEAETAALGRQLGTVIRDQRELTDQNGLKLRGAEAELATARARLTELEEFTSSRRCGRPP